MQDWCECQTPWCEWSQREAVHVSPAPRLCECSSNMSGILMLVVSDEAQRLSSGPPLVLIFLSGAIHRTAKLTFDPEWIRDILLCAAASSPSRHFNWKHIVLLSIHRLPRSQESREDMTVPRANYSFAASGSRPVCHRTGSRVHAACVSCSVFTGRSISTELITMCAEANSVQGIYIVLFLLTPLYTEPKLKQDVRICFSR